MTSSPVLVVATLAGAGITGAAIFFSAQVPQRAKLTATTQTTIASGAAAAWQAVRLHAPTELVEPEQVTVASISSRPPMPAEVSVRALNGGPLTRELQRELKSLGCYHGEINGVWTTSTRQAMKIFTDRANAKLPVTEPDQVLLALIKSNRHHACNGRPIAAVIPHPLQHDKTAPVEPGPLDAPPMALAGPKATEPDGNAAAPAKDLAAKTSGPRVVAGPRERSVEHWSVKLWRNTGN
jgi:peptidoglycan hydrolase-like protein with peptidoglycan-binding domain